MIGILVDFQKVQKEQSIHCAQHSEETKKLTEEQGQLIGKQESETKNS